MMIYIAAALSAILVLLLAAAIERKRSALPGIGNDGRVLKITLGGVDYRPAYNYVMAVLVIEYALRDLGIDKSSSKVWGIIADTIENKPIPEEHRYITNAIDRLPFSATPAMCRQVALDMLLASNDIQQITIDTRIGTGERLQAWLNQSMR